jgi:hypothetical protein
MCRVCEGFSIDDVLALDATRIAEYGFLLQGVVGPGGENDGNGSWVYTVGLLDAASHPELIVAGLSVNSGASLLSMLARSVLAGERYAVGETIDLGCGIARVGAVHDVQYELDTFNIWRQLRAIGVLREGDLEAVQIEVPDECLPSGSATQPVLADRDARVGMLS